MILKPINPNVNQIADLYQELYKADIKCVCRRAQGIIFYEVRDIIYSFEYQMYSGAAYTLAASVWELIQLALTCGARRAVATRFVNIKSEEIIKEMPYVLFQYKDYMSWERLMDYNSRFIHDEDFKFYAESFRTYCHFKCLRPHGDPFLFIAELTHFLIPYIKFQCGEKEKLSNLHSFLSMLEELKKQNSNSGHVSRRSNYI